MAERLIVRLTIAMSAMKYSCWKMLPISSGTEKNKISLAGFPVVMSCVMEIPVQRNGKRSRMAVITPFSSLESVSYRQSSFRSGCAFAIA